MGKWNFRGTGSGLLEELEEEKGCVYMVKYGKRVYDGTCCVKETLEGATTCPMCGNGSSLIKRAGYGFSSHFSRCEYGHNVQLDKTLYPKYQVGDRIRYYESTFGKDAIIRLDSYREGIVTASYPDIIDYRFDFQVDTCVMNGRPLPSTAWVIGSVCRGVNHHSTEVELISNCT